MEQVTSGESLLLQIEMSCYWMNPLLWSAPVTTLLILTCSNEPLCSICRQQSCTLPMLKLHYTMNGALVFLHSHMDVDQQSLLQEDSLGWQPQRIKWYRDVVAFRHCNPPRTILSDWVREGVVGWWQLAGPSSEERCEAVLELWGSRQVNWSSGW